jgi:hypothetical protein
MGRKRENGKLPRSMEYGRDGMEEDNDPAQVLLTLEAE